MNRRQALKSTGLLAAAAWATPLMSTSASAFPLHRRDFGPDFRWGVSASSYQIEGAPAEGGKSPSVWDTFSHSKGKILTGENGDMACDFYHRYAEDIALVKAMGFGVFRFSLSWPRILPEGTGRVNPEGIAFYNRVIDACLAEGIEPWITLYHWDLPQVLEDRGGWPRRDMVDWFAEYATVCARAFGDRVRHWMVLNEPMVFSSFGYMTGWHAPGRRGFGNFLPAAHHAALAQAEGARALRAQLPNAVIGTTFSMSWVEPLSERECHRRAAARMDTLVNRFFLEPALGMGYPTAEFPFIGRIEKYMQPGDEARLAFDFDFIGLQNYTRILTQFSLMPPVLFAKERTPKRRGLPATDMGWEIYPEGIYHLLKKLAAYPNMPRILVTENGAAFPDQLQNGAVHDAQRVAYFEAYLAQVHRAMQEGVKVDGYFVWSLLDNYEWREGYRPRFGIVYVDYASQQRYLKDSGKWWQQFLNAP